MVYIDRISLKDMLGNYRANWELVLAWGAIILSMWLFAVRVEPDLIVCRMSMEVVYKPLSAGWVSIPLDGKLQGDMILGDSAALWPSWFTSSTGDRSLGVGRVHSLGAFFRFWGPLQALQVCGATRMWWSESRHNIWSPSWCQACRMAYACHGSRNQR